MKTELTKEELSPADAKWAAWREALTKALDARDPVAVIMVANEMRKLMPPGGVRVDR